MLNIIFIASGLILLFIITFLKYEYDKEKQHKEKLKQQNISIEIPLIHLGGHPYLQSGDRVFLQLQNNKTIYFHKENTDTGNKILITQLTRYEIKTESEIHKDVTLTRLLALGIFAFGIKKKTEINNQYLILSYNQNNVEINCLFQYYGDSRELGNLISILNKIKIESIQNNSII